ncbi:MAG: asparagine--tRNA ligase [Thermoplasmata archaeon]|nr:asparagine--tRNA ligase [Candidatus Sysuiplasma acidicola]MBX8645398.1 asparagine--tRNA ligase [Candidatus Sysuiplasma acidicola]MDH2905837.1 asparagine--tRNA ligase [Methanomassiliicoccales archaeon]
MLIKLLRNGAPRGKGKVVCLANVFTSIRDVISSGEEGKSFSIRGWIYRTRSSGSIVFTVMRDATGIVQCTVKKSGVPPEDFEQAAKALIETSAECTGSLKADARAPGGYELVATSFKVISFAEPFPITENQSEPFLLDNRHLWIRSREQTAIMKVKASILLGAREWFTENDFCEVTPPILTTNACEGGTTLFPLKYFDQNAYLSQSAQMYLEALTFSLERVFAVTPSFRAEKSRTPRHLTEYWHLEGEEAWVNNEGNMHIQEELVSHVVRHVLQKRKEELAVLKRNVEDLKAVEPPFVRLTYENALKMLSERGMNAKWGDDFGTEEEKMLTLDSVKPVFVTNFPKEIKAFYMKENEQDSRTYSCADLIAPEGFGEVIGGSERETDVRKLVARMEEQSIPLEPYAWYLDLRKYGSVPHSGFGLGVERLVKWICKLDHIRDAVPFPRTPSRIYP